MSWLNGLGDPSLAHPNPDRTASVFGTGQVRAILNDMTDVARYTARIVFDPRTLNRRVMCDGHEATVEEIVAKWEWITEKEMVRRHVGAKEIERRIREADGFEKLFPQVGSVGCREFWSGEIWDR